jgi:hypothetical protein
MVKARSILANVIFLAIGIIGTLSVRSAFGQAAGAANGVAGVNMTQIILDLVNNLAFPIVGAFATYLINDKVKNHQLATQLSNAVQNGLGVIQQDATSVIKSANLTIPIQDPRFRKGVQYVLDNAEEAVAHWRISPDKIAQKLEAKIGLAELGPNGSPPDTREQLSLIREMARVPDESKGSVLAR